MKLLLLVYLCFLTGFTMSQTLQQTEKIKFLALGDSYTIGEAVDEAQRWPVQLVHQLRKKGFNAEEPKIIATTGWRTDDLKSAILKENPSNDYNLVSLLIGVNNQYQGKSAESYGPEFQELLRMAIEFAGGDKSKVFVVSIPDYGFTPFGKEKKDNITMDIDEFNSVNKKITQALGVKYFNITDISRKGFDDPELVASDGLHPSGKMYTLWVERILEGL